MNDLFLIYVIYKEHSIKRDKDAEMSVRLY